MFLHSLPSVSLVGSSWLTGAAAFPFRLSPVSRWDSSLIGPIAISLLFLEASTQKTGFVSAAAPLAEHAREMLPTVTLVKETLSWAMGYAWKLALKSMWPWKASANTVQKCARTASTRKLAKVTWKRPEERHTLSRAQRNTWTKLKEPSHKKI